MHKTIHDKKINSNITKNGIHVFPTDSSSR